MSLQPQFKLVNMLTALYCVTMIHQLFQGRACTNTILVKLSIAVVAVNIRSRSLKSNSFLSPNNVSMQVWCRKAHWFRRQSSEKAEFTGFFLRMMTFKW